jgi:hypothetical protein
VNRIALKATAPLPPGDAEELANKSGFELRGTDVQLPAIALPQRLSVDCNDAADFELRNTLGREQLD